MGAHVPRHSLSQSLSQQSPDHRAKGPATISRARQVTQHRNNQPPCIPPSSSLGTFSACGRLRRKGYRPQQCSSSLTASTSLISFSCSQAHSHRSLQHCRTWHRDSSYAPQPPQPGTELAHLIQLEILQLLGIQTGQRKTQGTGQLSMKACKF